MFHVEIEPTNNCNTRCLHCPHEAISRPYGMMDMANYETIIAKVLTKHPRISVEYAGMGDPLLNVNIYSFIKRINDVAITSLTTNAAALTPKNLEKLIDAGLDHLTISFNGPDKELYELMMGGLNFETAQSRIKMAVEMTKGTRTAVRSNVSVTKQTQPRLTDIKRYINDAGIESIFFSKCHMRGGFMKQSGICDTPLPPDKADTRCDVFTETLFVAWSGDVLACCHDLAGGTRLGNLVTDPLDSILEKKAEIAHRGVMFNICRGCVDMQRYMTDNTPDRQPLAEWIYTLYAKGDEQAQQFAKHIQAAGDALDEKDREINELRALLLRRQQQIEEMRGSISWRVMEPLRQVKAKVKGK
jgi:MoaA/NifB/PqqE/SkfB family radical SAM enzyme